MEREKNTRTLIRFEVETTGWKAHLLTIRPQVCLHYTSNALGNLSTIQSLAETKLHHSRLQIYGNE